VPLVAGWDLVQVVANAHTEVDGATERLFDRAACTLCRAPRGNRSSEPLKVSWFDSTAEGGFAVALPYPSPPHLQFVSERFLALLTPAERRQFEWRPVTCTRGRPRKKYYEAIPRTLVPYAAVKGLHDPLVTCDRCRRVRTMAVIQKGSGLWHFLAEKDLPRPLPGLFAAGTPIEYDLCMPRRRWEAIRARPGARGWLSESLGVVAAAHVAARPARKLLSRALEEEERLIRELERGP
jgi:hypothetical protein